MDQVWHAPTITGKVQSTKTAMICYGQIYRNSIFGAILGVYIIIPAQRSGLLYVGNLHTPVYVPSYGEGLIKGLIKALLQSWLMPLETQLCINVVVNYN